VAGHSHALPAHCDDPEPPELSALLGARANCSCTWQPENGFDGFGSAIALLSVAFAAALALAAAYSECSLPSTRQLL
jgi:hypothetical protein